MEKNTLQNALNELSKGTTDNIDSIMIRDAAGNQYWIAKSDLASVLGGLIRDSLSTQILSYWGSSINQFREFYKSSGASYHSFLFNISRTESDKTALYNVICATTSAGSSAMTVKCITNKEMPEISFRYKKDDNGITHFYVSANTTYVVCAVTELSYYPKSACDDIDFINVDEPSDAINATVL